MCTFSLSWVAEAGALERSRGSSSRGRRPQTSFSGVSPSFVFPMVFLLAFFEDRIKIDLYQKYSRP
jgi:hypothetical protein